MHPRIRLLLIAVFLLPSAMTAGPLEDWITCQKQVLPDLGGPTPRDPKTPVEAYCLGLAYTTGKGSVRIDDIAAAQFYRRAAEKGHAPAQTVLGYLYEKGQGVSPDPAQAVVWYRKAADQGLPDALFNLGRVYQHGVGVKADLGEAKKWYQLAAAKGSEGAAAELKRMGEAPQPGQANFNEGTKLYEAKDFAGATRSLKKAADLANAHAQASLDYLYERGEGVTKEY